MFHQLYDKMPREGDRACGQSVSAKEGGNNVEKTVDHVEQPARPVRKRTRSKRGQLFDKMRKKSSHSSGKAKQRKTDEVKTKSNVSRHIVFSDERQQKPEVGFNNNATVTVDNRSSRSKPDGKSVKMTRIDPCFKNVLEKELAMERKQNQIAKGAKTSKMNGCNKKTRSMLQGTGAAGVGQNHKDRIDIDVELEEDLDYVDDVTQGSDIESVGFEEEDQTAADIQVAESSGHGKQ